MRRRFLAGDDEVKRRQAQVNVIAAARGVRPISPGGEELAGLLETVGLSGLAERARGSGGESKDSVITCRISAADLEAIDALIEAGIRTTRSDAAAWLIRAGLEAHRDLLEKVAATVAEIRRLREQARALVDSMTPTEEEPT
jgi:Arc/MetJ-type ribon-helix-helix transcriptional regulator